MNIIRSIIVGATALVAVSIASPASAEEPWPLMHLANTVPCVRADFTITGSGWRIQQAVAIWNAAQPFIQFRMAYNEACNDVIVHRYYKADDDRCGYASYDRLWATARYGQSGVVLYDGADVYLNDWCIMAGSTYPIIQHELGHVMGLGHSHSTRSVMSTAYRYEGSIFPVDVTALAVLYSHG